VLHENSSPFRDFTLDEWRRAFEIGGNNRETAMAYAQRIVASAPMANGYSLDAELWALLALVSHLCAERVRVYMEREPDVIRRQVEDRVTGLDRRRRASGA